MALNVKQISTLTGSCLLHLMVGSLATYGNLNTYITSYLRHNVSADANYGQSVWFTPVGVTAFTSFTIISGLFVKKIGTKITSLLAYLMFCGSIAVTSIAVKKSFIAILMSFGLLANISNGLIYSSAIVNCMKWYPNQKGLVSGVITGVNAFSSFIFTQIQTFYLNPNNVKPNSDGYFDDKELLAKVPQLFIVLSIIYGVIGFLGVCLTFDYKEIQQPNQSIQTDTNDNPMSTSIISEDNEILVVSSQSRNQYAIRRAIKTRFFYMLWFTFAFGTQSSYYINSIIKAFGQNFITDDHYLAVTLSLCFIINGIGGVFWGKIMDILKFRDTVIAINAIMAISTFSLIICSYVWQKLLFAVWVFVMYFTSVGIFSCFLPEVVRKFGDKNAIIIYGIIHTGPVVASLMLSPLLEWTLNSVGWFPTFCTVGALNSLSMIIIMAFYYRFK